MVSALSRKELNQTIIQSTRFNSVPVRKASPSAISKENFPYALQEFINSHMDLPTFEEIINNQDKPAYSLNMAR
jgi:hypothetical protein